MTNQTVIGLVFNWSSATFYSFTQHFVLELLHDGQTLMCGPIFEVSIEPKSLLRRYKPISNIKPRSPPLPVVILCALPVPRADSPCSVHPNFNFEEWRDPLKKSFLLFLFVLYVLFYNISILLNPISISMNSPQFQLLLLIYWYHCMNDFFGFSEEISWHTNQYCSQWDKPQRNQKWPILSVRKCVL